MIQRIFCLACLISLSFSLPTMAKDDRFLRLQSKGAEDLKSLKEKLLEKSRSTDSLDGNEFFIYKAVFDAWQNSLKIFASLPKDSPERQLKINDLKVMADKTRLVDSGWTRTSIKNPDCETGYIVQTFNFNEIDQSLEHQELLNNLAEITLLDLSQPKLGDLAIKKSLTMEVERISIENGDQGAIGCAEPLYWTRDPIDLILFIEYLTSGHRDLSKVIIPVGSVSETVMKVLKYYENQKKVIIHPAPMLPFTDEYNKNLNTTYNRLFESYCAEVTQNGDVIANGFGYSTNSPIGNALKTMKASLKLEENQINFTPIISTPNSLSWIGGGASFGDPKKTIDYQNEVLAKVVETIPKIFEDAQDLPQIDQEIELVNMMDKCVNPILDRFDDLISKEDWIFAQPGLKAHWHIF